MAAGDPTAVRASGLRPGAYAAVVFGLGLLLAGLALPQFLAALARVGGDAALTAVGAGRDLPPHQVERAMRSRRNAASMWPTHEDMSDIALLQLSGARQMDLDRQSGQRRLQLDRAIGSARQAIALNAGNPYSWMRLAEGLFLRNGLDDETAAAVVRAMELGPAVQQMILPRLELAFLLDAQLTEPQRAVVEEQIRLAVLWNPAGLVRHARRRYAVGIVRRALASTPDRLAVFDAAWEASR